MNSSLDQVYRYFSSLASYSRFPIIPFPDVSNVYQSLTCDNLMRRGYVMVGWCCMCKGSGELVDHLLLHCEVVWEVWNFILRSFGVSWVFPTTVSELLFGWHNWWGKQSSFVWNLVPHCIMWTIWRAQNGRTFEDMEHSVGKIIERVMGSLYDWSCAWGICSSHS